MVRVTSRSSETFLTLERQDKVSAGDSQSLLGFSFELKSSEAAAAHFNFPLSLSHEFSQFPF